MSEADLERIRQLREAHPQWSRQRLSVHLAEEWQWRNQAGRLKDMAARTLLLKLQARGLVELPAPLRGGGNRRRKPSASGPAPLELPNAPPAPIQGALHLLRPLGLELVSSLTQRRRVSQLLEQYHYLGYRGAVGENVQYLARDAQERVLAVMVFGAAAWKVAARDQFIGWSDPQRRARLGWITNQQRFLIPPRPPCCCRTTSIAGVSRSITGMRKRSWVSVKRRCGMRSRSAKCRRYWWPCRAGCSCRAWPVMGQRERRTTNPCPSGGATPRGHPVWTWSPFYASNGCKTQPNLPQVRPHQPTPKW